MDDLDVAVSLMWLAAVRLDNAGANKAATCLRSAIDITCAGKPIGYASALDHRAGVLAEAIPFPRLLSKS